MRFRSTRAVRALSATAVSALVLATSGLLQWLVRPVMNGSIGYAVTAVVLGIVAMAVRSRGDFLARLQQRLPHIGLPLIAAATLLVGTAASIGSTLIVYGLIHEAANNEFRHESERLARQIGRGLTQYTYGLRGARGIFVATDHIDRPAFLRYIASRDIATEFPGALGFGYIERVPRDQLDDFVIQGKADGVPDFRIRTAGEHKDLFVIKYIEPLEVNQKALGYDIGSEDLRREAAERAMRTGQATITGRITLLQDSQKLAGFLYLLPVYRDGTDLDSPADRDQGLQGWVYTPLLIDNLLTEVAATFQTQLEFELFQSPGPSETDRVYDSRNGSRPESPTASHTDDSDLGVRRFQTRQILDVGNREWLVRITSSPGFESAIDRASPKAVFAGGMALTLLTVTIVWTMGQSRRRASDLAAAMTADLRESETEAVVARLRAEQALKALDHQKFAMDQHSIVAVTDSSGTITYVNDRFCEISGFSVEELIGQKHRIINSGHHPRSFWVQFWGTIRAGKVWHGEICNRSKSGSLYWVDTTIVPFKGVEGRVTQYVAIRTDITAQKRIEEELASAMLRLEAVLDSATEVSVIATSVDGLITMFSRGAEKMLGYRAEEMVGLQTPAVIHDGPEVERRGKGLSQQFGRTIAGFDVFIEIAKRDGSETSEWTYICKDGTRKQVSLSVTPQQNADGAVFGFVGTALDISDVKRAERELRELALEADDSRARVELQAGELEQQALSLRDARLRAESASRAKSEFLANMSHEIRTPLTSILGYTEMLLDDHYGSASPERRRETVAIILSAGQHLLQIINDILDLSKIEADQMVLEKIETDLPEVLQHLQSLLQPRAMQGQVELTFRIGTPIPEKIVGDPTRLRQILMNLIGNAIKFSEAGTVTVIASTVHTATGDRLHVDIEDTGTGMTPEQADRLFRPFSQADASVTRRFGGTGLGLTICRRLASLMGGDVELVRTATGKGSVFRLDLPLDAVPGTARTTRIGGGLRTSISPVTKTFSLERRILLAEDSEPNRRLVAYLLAKAGARVDAAENGQIALDLWSRAEAAGDGYGLLLTDMQMPVMDGYTLARELRARGTSMPIVALTAHAMADERLKCLEAGCDECATKPIDFAELLALCDLMLRKSPDASGLATVTAAPTPSEAQLPLPAESEVRDNPSGHWSSFDYDAALNRVQGDVEFLRELVEIYLKHSPRMLQDVQSAAGQSDPAALAQAAHLLRGSATSLQAVSLVAAARSMESMGLKGTLDGLPDTLEEVEKLSQELQRDLQQFLAAPAPQ